MQKVINEYLAKRGITQTQLAEEIGLDKGHFSRILSGERAATLAVLKKLAQKTGKSLDELAKG
jgi:transcriptional regulator with XRE-family HTH domain